MLLAIDVGNSNTSVGLFDQEKNLRFLAYLDTDSRKTADQISIDLMNLFTLYHYSYTDVTGAILCSVVPPLNFMMEKALTRLLGKPPMVVGRMLLPGVNVSLEALSRRAAQLPAISLQHPKTVIGKNTEDCMRSGIVYGTAGMLDGIIDRIRGEFPGKEVSVVATGGNAPVIVRYCRNPIVYDKYLLMNGLWTIYQKNR